MFYTTKALSCIKLFFCHILVNLLLGIQLIQLVIFDLAFLFLLLSEPRFSQNGRQMLSTP